MGSSARAGSSRPLAWSAAAAALLLVACLVPLVLISRYNHSYADDWHYGVWAHLALEEGVLQFPLPSPTQGQALGVEEVEEHGAALPPKAP